MTPETEPREDFPVGNETNREPETDQTGMYAAVLDNIKRVAKTAEDIERESKMFGKDPDKIDKAQYFWDFAVPGFSQTLRVYTGTFFGDKAKATDVAAALLGHRPGKSETVTAAMLWDKPCQVLVEFDQEKGRNRITKVMPPKRAPAALPTADTVVNGATLAEHREAIVANAQARTAELAPTFAQAAQEAAHAPLDGPSESAVAEAVALRQASMTAPGTSLMAGAAESEVDEAYWQKLAEQAPAPEAEE